MTKRTRNKKGDTDHYEHVDEDRLNNPPVGLVSHATDPDAGKKTYQYDPHIDPALQFDSQGSEVERILDDGLAAAQVDSDDPKALLAGLQSARAALQELK